MERQRFWFEQWIFRDAAVAFVSSPSPRYYVPGDSPWPFLGAIALFITLSGAATLLFGSHEFGAILLSLGGASVLAVLAGWFISAVGDAHPVAQGFLINRSFRLGMLVFLGVEAALFAAGLGAWAYTRDWSSVAAAARGRLVAPLLSTLLLMLAALTVTLAHR